MSTQIQVSTERAKVAAEENLARAIKHDAERKVVSDSFRAVQEKMRQQGMEAYDEYINRPWWSRGKLPDKAYPYVYGSGLSQMRLYEPAAPSATSLRDVIFLNESPTILLSVSDAATLFPNDQR